MTYDPTVPQANQFISTSQPIIQANFNKLNVDFNVDHNPYTTPIGAGNGEHKRITFTNVGTPPYTIAGTKSYAYSEFIDTTPGTLTYVNYQSAGTDAISGLAPVCPISPRCLFYGQFLVGPTFNLLRSFNVSSVVVAGFIVVTFQEPLPDTNYIVLVSKENVPIGGIFAKSTTGFSINQGVTPFGTGFGCVVF